MVSAEPAPPAWTRGAARAGRRLWQAAGLALAVSLVPGLAERPAASERGLRLSAVRPDGSVEELGLDDRVFFAGRLPWSVAAASHLRFAGMVDVPRAERHRFRLVADGPAELQVGGTPLAGCRTAPCVAEGERRLPAGPVAIAITYRRGAETSPAELRVEWRGERGRFETIPAARLSAEDQRARRAPPWRVLARPARWIALSLGVLALVVRAAASRRVRAGLGALAADRALLAVAAVVLAQVALLWTFPFFPSQDGAVHVENANIVRQYRAPDRALFRTFYEPNPHVEPNWIGHAALAVLLGVLPPAAAEKAVLSAYVLLLPLSVAYALGAFARGAALVALVLPFTFNWALHMGFYNFCLGLPLLFFTWGFWLRHGARLTLGRAVSLSLLALLLYFAHVVPFALGLALIGASALWLTLLEARRGGEAFRGRLVSRTVATAHALAPALVLLATFLVRSGSARGGVADAPERWRALGRLSTLVSFDALEEPLARTVSVAFALLLAAGLWTAVRRRRPAEGDAFLVGALVALAAYRLAPSGVSAGAYLHERLQLLPFLLLVPWLATLPLDPRVRRGAVAAGLVLGLASTAVHARSYARLSPFLEEYASARPHLEPDTIVLPLCFVKPGRDPDGGAFPSGIDPFVHAAGYLAAEKPLVQLANYEANKGQFPLLFRAGVNPYLELGESLESHPPCVDLARYTRTSGQPIDAVLVFGLHRRHLEQECARSLVEELEGRYDLVHRSAPRGLVRLYRLRPLPIG